MVPAPASSDSVLTPDGRRMPEATNKLPEEEREVFARYGSSRRLRAGALTLTYYPPQRG
jgi:hypothetical protein